MNELFHTIGNKLKLSFKTLFPSGVRAEKNLADEYLRITEGFSEKELSTFLNLGVVTHFTQGEVVFRENDTADSFYIILEGQAEIYKEAVDEFGDSHVHIIANLNKDDVVGDMALIENKPRSATFRAKTDLKTLKFDLTELKKNTAINLQLTQNLSRMLSERLRYTNEYTVKAMEDKLKEAQARNVLGVFMIVLFWLISLYTLSLTGIIALGSHLRNSTPLSVVMIMIFACVILFAIKKTGLGLERFGVTLKNWKKIALEAVLYTLPFMILFLIIKIDSVYFSPNPHQVHLFSGTNEFYVDNRFHWERYFGFMTLYAVFSPIQELMSRCALQSTFFLFLPVNEKFRKWNSILLSNVIFSSAHSHMGLTVALITFIPGLFWGWMFHKQRSIVGVSVSHVLIGVWVFFILGVKGILGIR